MRNPAIELFRCLLMFLIVLCHASMLGHWRHDVSLFSLNFWCIALTMWHVDGFVAISGWFGIRFSWKKILRLWGLCAFYTMLSAVWVFTKEPDALSIKSFVIQGGWFAGSYFMLMFMAPLLNDAVEFAIAKGNKYAFGIWITFVVGIILDWAPFNLMSGVSVAGGGWKSILLLVFIYVTTRFVRLSKFEIKWNLVGFVLVLYFLGVAGCGGSVMCVEYVRHGVWNWHKIYYWTSYNAPHVWLMAIVLLMVFAQKVKLPKCVERFVLLCSPSMFGIYLLHETTSFGRKIYQLPELWFATNTQWHPVVIVFVCAIFAFCFCLVVDMVRRGIVASAACCVRSLK